MNKTSTTPGQLLILRGLPGSGKSTFARKWVNESPSNRVRVNRDDLRMMTFDRKVNLTQKEEESITALEHSLVVSSLSRGLNVVVDAMHLRPRYVTNWYKVASSLGTTAAIHAYTLTSNDHQLHHEKDSTKNYGNIFSIWDRCFGTYGKNNKFLTRPLF